MINDKVDPFITQYRDALERQRDLSKQYVDNQRRNDFANIMSTANASGMMYSNFPERSKIQYDTSTYQPNLAKVRDTYRTGLDKLRSNTLNLSNELKNINDAIADLRKNGVNGSGGGGGGGSNDNSLYGVDMAKSTAGQTWYKNNQTGNSVRFGTYAKSLGGNYKGLLQSAANAGDNDSKIVMNYLNSNPNATIGYMGGNGAQAYDNSTSLKQALNRLGITISTVK